MQKVLITGGTGFIGRNLMKKCEDNGVDYISCGIEVDSENEHTCYCDIMNIESIKSIMASYKPDAIIHLAAIAAPVHKDIAEIYSINVHGTENMLNSAAEVLTPDTRFILISTAGVYGNNVGDRYSESLNYNPANHYSCSKMVTEIWSRQFENNLDISVVRPFNIIGKGQSPNFFVPKLINAFLRKDPELILGNLKAVRDYIPCEFCAEVLLKLALCRDNPPRILNICSGVGHTCEDVVKTLEELTDYHPIVKTNEEFIRSNEVWHLVGDTTRLSEFMGYDVSKDYLREVLITMLA